MEQNKQQQQATDDFFVATKPQEITFLLTGAEKLLSNIETKNDIDEDLDKLFQMCLLSLRNFYVHCFFLATKIKLFSLGIDFSGNPEKNRETLMKTKVLTVLFIGLKVKKTAKALEMICRTLQLFIEDVNVSLELHKMGICPALTEVLRQKEKEFEEDELIPIISLIYWLTQVPECRDNFRESELDLALKRMSKHASEEGILCQFLKKCVSAFENTAVSCEMMKR